MRIDIITLFPEIALSPLSDSIIKRAREQGLVDIHAHQLRDWATGKHRKTDDYLCGGGQGMLMMPEPVFAAVDELKQDDTRIILMTPQGKPFIQADAQRLSTSQHVIILCGHYEGVDHRIIDALVVTRCELVEEFEHFMKGCGYHFTDDECIAITSKENV